MQLEPKEKENVYMYVYIHTHTYMRFFIHYCYFLFSSRQGLCFCWVHEEEERALYK